MRRPGTRRWAWAGVLASLLAAGPVMAGRLEGGKSVLLLQTGDGNSPPWRLFLPRLRARMEAIVPERIDYTTVSVEWLRSDPEAYDEALLAYVAAQYDTGTPDLVIAVGRPAALFLQRNRARLYPAVPAMVTGVDRMTTAPTAWPKDVFVSLENDVAVHAEAVRRLFPQMNAALFVLGASQTEKAWKAALRPAIEKAAPHVVPEWTDEYTLDRLLRRAALQPPTSVVYFVSFERDVDGHVQDREDRLLRLLGAATRVPIVVTFEEELQPEVTVALLRPFDQLAESAAQHALRLLAGEPPEQVHPEPLRGLRVVVNAQHLERLGLRADQLPPGTELAFAEPGTWARYGLAVTATLVVGGLAAMLILGLVIAWRRQRHSAEAVVNLQKRLLSVQDEERRLMARELHDNIAQRLARVAIDVGRMQRPGADVGTLANEVHQGIRELNLEISGLSHRVHPLALEKLGLHEALEREVEAMAERHGLAPTVACEALPKGTPPEVTTELFRIAQEALRNVARHAHASEVRVVLRVVSGRAELTVRDDGVGLPADAQQRPGLGLTSMRERVKGLNGQLSIVSNAGHGTTVQVIVPLAEEKAA